MSRNFLNNAKKFISSLTEQTLQTIIVVVVLAALAIWGVKYLIETTHIGTEYRTSTSSTPTTINSIKNIGEWEFLTISDEELVDSVRKSLLGSSELIRIYYGTLRLGVNLNDTIKNWIKSNGDTLHVMMPKIKLLDNDFIDEAKTESFYETGKWNANELNGMFEKARKKMLQRCLTKENIDNAEQNAITQLSNMFRAVGFNTIYIEFAK